jgi:DNA-directed RNA polymerase specialized sigma24 family protein
MIAPAPLRPDAVAEKLTGGAQNETPNNIAVNVAIWIPFERFVFVMAVLEGYSLRECAAFLGCPVQDVAAAKSAALQKVTKQPEQSPVQAEADPWHGFARAQVA